MSMAKNYDEFAVNCSGCGWLRSGQYLDGMPYLACFWHGTIMHDNSDQECRDYRTPGQAEKYLERMRKAEAERERQTKETRRRHIAQLDRDMETFTSMEQL